MDPLRPIDPDEEFPREAADKPGASDFDVETPLQIQSAAAPERRPTDVSTESTDNPVGAESDLVSLAPSSEAGSTNARPTSFDGADVIPSSALDLVPSDAMSELTSTFFDSAPATRESGPAISAGQLPSIDPADTAPPTDVIPSPEISDSNASADRAIPGDSWPDTSSDFYAALQQTPLPVIAPLNTDAPSSPLDTDSFKDRSSLPVDQEPSREGSLDDQGRHDTPPAKDDKSDQADAQPESSPVERNRKAALREEIERFIENFYAQMARADALLSPPVDGGPPMARPIVLVSLDEERMQAIANETLAESGSRLAMTAAEIAEDKVNEAFWLRDCEMRALYRGR